MSGKYPLLHGDAMFVFTSCTNNYLPKARVLASSLKTFHPDWTFCLLLGEAAPEGFDLSSEPFDRVEFFDQLGIMNYRSWLFRHRVVEICTAAKGPALYHFLVEERHERVMYLDPDIMVCNSLTPLEAQLDDNDILLTPHLLTPQPTKMAIEDNEIAALQHGVFNLGFLAVARRGQGLSFARWWRDRLLDYCHDDIPRGLFTDQRWCDLAPSFFSRLWIVRDYGCNTASWNLTERVITRDDGGIFKVNGEPLRFYHFTGYDSGAGRYMTAKYAPTNSPVFDLWNEYGRRLEVSGQKSLGSMAWSYSYFENGEPITDHMRQLYRQRADVQAAFPDPFASPGYLEWYRADQFPEASRKIKKGIRRVRLMMRKAVTEHGGILPLARDIAGKYLTSGRQNHSVEVDNSTLPLQEYALPQLEDTLKSPRDREVLGRLIPREAEPVLLVEHDWGGGAARYIEERASSLLQEGHAVMRLKYSLSEKRLELLFMYHGKRARYALDQILSLSDVLFSSLSAVVLSEVASWFPDEVDCACGEETMRRVSGAIRDIAAVAQTHNATLEVLFHDFYAVCPRINFVRDDRPCPAPQDCSHCDVCLKHGGTVQWRSAWQSVLSQAHTVTFFSESSRRIIEQFFVLRKEQVMVQPHSLSSYALRPVRISTAGPMRIAVVGVIGRHKGSKIIVKLAKLLEQRRPDASIIVFGTLQTGDTPKNIRILGKYAREELSLLFEREQISAAAFTSICPETFSYVAHEIAAMCVPLASFNLGAQGELVAGLGEKGRLARAVTAEALLEALIELDDLRKRGNGDS